LRSANPRRRAKPSRLRTARLDLGPLLLALFLIAGLAPAPAAGSDEDETLGDFEKEIQKEDRSRRPGPDPAERPSDTLERQEGEAAAKAAAGWLIADLVGNAILSTWEGHDTRETGLPALASLRLENGWQRLADADVDGYEVRADAFYRGFGISAEYLRYWETRPSDQLTAWTLEARVRFVPDEHVRLDLAVGVRGIERESSHTGLHGGASFGLYPSRWLGLEADLRWADVGDRLLGDYRGGLLVRLSGLPHVALRGGYRAIHVGDSTLHGPELGLVLTW